jgi:hypothetical protein
MQICGSKNMMIYVSHDVTNMSETTSDHYTSPKKPKWRNTPAPKNVPPASFLFDGRLSTSLARDLRVLEEPTPLISLVLGQCRKIRLSGSTFSALGDAHRPVCMSLRCSSPKLPAVYLPHLYTFCMTNTSDIMTYMSLSTSVPSG